MKAPGRKQPTKGPLDEAIEALALARECGGESDLHIYASAHQRLEQLKAQMMAHDEKLSRDEAPPGGDDYNQIFEMMLPGKHSISPAAEQGKFWPTPQHLLEALAIQAEHPAKALEPHPEDSSPRRDR